MATINEDYFVRDYALTDQVRVSIYYDAVRGYLNGGEPVENLESTEVCIRFFIILYLKSSSSTFRYPIYLNGIEAQNLLLYGNDTLKGNEAKFNIRKQYGWFTLHQPSSVIGGVRVIVKTSYRDLTLNTGLIDLRVPQRVIPSPPENPPSVRIDRIEVNELNELLVYWSHTGGNAIKELNFSLWGQWHKVWSLDNPFILRAFIYPNTLYDVRIRGVDWNDRGGNQSNIYQIRSKDTPKISELSDLVLSIKDPIKIKVENLNTKAKTILEIDNTIRREITQRETNIILKNDEIAKLYRKYKENVVISIKTPGQEFRDNKYINVEYKESKERQVLSKGNHQTVSIKKDNKIKKGIVYIKKDGKLRTGIIYIRKGNKVRRGII